ncbi:kinase-like domain-containing protein [Gongronella butleri]|nr:kinase-like domain-containing protein [Gongronella butleri]
MKTKFQNIHTHTRNVALLFASLLPFLYFFLLYLLFRVSDFSFSHFQAMKWLCLGNNNQVSPERDTSAKASVFDQFEMLRLLGQGAFGQVHLIRHKKMKKLYALKTIDKDQCIRRRATAYIVAERQLLEQLSYPLIVNLRYAFQDDHYLYMAMDYMPGGDLRHYMARHGALFLSERDVRTIVADLALAIRYLHQHRICHRDIKPENILIDEKGHAHLGDFNIATRLDQPMQWSKAGSLAYMAPEVLSRQGWTLAIDWWALAIVTYELIYGKRPFVAASNELLMQAILYQPVTFPTQTPSHHVVSHACRQFLQGMLLKTPRQRPCFQQPHFPQDQPWFDGIDWQQLEQKKALTNLKARGPMGEGDDENENPTRRIATSNSASSSSGCLGACIQSSLLYPSVPAMTPLISTKHPEPPLYNQQTQKLCMYIPDHQYKKSSPCRPRPASMDDIHNVTEQAQWREWLEQAFQPFDYVSVHSPRSWRSLLPSCF